MNKMMSVAAFAAALTLTASCALAATADAKIVAPNTEKITAPFAGTLLPFDYETGDSVSAHETLFTLDTTPVYATQAGTVSAVFASVGDDASGVAAHYGALAVIEPKNALYIDASTDQAYNDADNRYIHAGETLYLKLSNDKGTGVVTSVYPARSIPWKFSPAASMWMTPSAASARAPRLPTARSAAAR